MEGTDPEVQNSGGTKGRVEGDCYGGPKMSLAKGRVERS